MIKLAIGNFEKMGLRPTIMRTPHSIFTKRGTSVAGFYSESPNKQYEYDHKEDEALFLDKKMANRRLEVQKEAHETYKTLCGYQAGPAWVEVFGEKPFTPQICPQAYKLSKKQQEISTWYYGQLGQMVNAYIPGEERSFTIIAFPIPEIGAICREKGIWFHTDAVQVMGHIPVDVQAMNIDMLSMSAHKFHGPKGVGVLYAKRGTLLTNLIEGGAQERGKRAGTENIPAIMGMVAALEEACAKIEENTAKLTALRDKLIAGLSEIPHSILNGDAKQRLPGNVNFCFEGIEGESLLLLLDDKGICASSGSACTSGSLDPSHVLLAIGRVHDIAHGSLRLSLSEENTEEEIDYTIKAVKEVVEYLRGISPIWRDLVSGKKEFIIK